MRRSTDGIRPLSGLSRLGRGSEAVERASAGGDARQSSSRHLARIAAAVGTPRARTSLPYRPAGESERSRGTPRHRLLAPPACRVRRWLLLAWLLGPLRGIEIERHLLGSEDRAQPRPGSVDQRSSRSGRLVRHSSLGSPRRLRERRSNRTRVSALGPSIEGRVKANRSTGDARR